jgi:hypothetical protein
LFEKTTSSGIPSFAGGDKNRSVHELLEGDFNAIMFNHTVVKQFQKGVLISFHNLELHFQYQSLVLSRLGNQDSQGKFLQFYKSKLTFEGNFVFSWTKQIRNYTFCKMGQI